jgi:hypothetical protein
MLRGQIIARSPTTWLVRLYQGRESSTGKRRYLNKTVEGERSAAEAELARLLSQIPPRPEARSSLDQYLDWGHAAVDGRLRAKTARDYRTLLARYVRPELGQIKLGRLRPLDLQSLIVSLTSRGLSPRTVRYTHAVFEKRARTGQALEANDRESSRRPAAAPRRQTRVPCLDARGSTTLYFVLPRGSGGARFSGGPDHGPAAQRISGAQHPRL